MKECHSIDNKDLSRNLAPIRPIHTVQKQYLIISIDKIHVMVLLYSWRYTNERNELFPFYNQMFFL